MEINNLKPSQLHNLKHSDTKAPGYKLPSYSCDMPKESVIISAKSSEEKAQINKILAEESVKITADLDIINSLGVSIPKDKKEEIIQKLPEGTSVTKDSPIKRASVKEKFYYDGYNISTPLERLTKFSNKDSDKTIFEQENNSNAYFYSDDSLSNYVKNNPITTNLTPNYGLSIDAWASQTLNHDKLFITNQNVINGDSKSNKTITEFKKNEQKTITFSNNVFFESLGIDKLHEQGITGKGVGVCVIDSGIYNHEDFGDKVVAWKDFSPLNADAPADLLGHGTIITGLIAGDGKASDGKIQGVAPDVDIISARASSVSESILALQWAIENKDKYNIKVVNISMGAPSSSVTLDPWAQAASKAVEAGLTVVVAAGNDGPKRGTVTSPGTSPDVITVGTIDDRGTVGLNDDIIDTKSGRGPTKEGINKPDIWAPGVNISSTSSPAAIVSGDSKFEGKYTVRSGSSLSTPIVSGVCALLLQANPMISPEEIKSLLRETANNVLDPENSDINGLAINPNKAIEQMMNSENLS